MQQPAQGFKRVRHALQKMSFALVKAAKAVSSQRLHQADEDVSIVVLHEHFALKLDETGKRVEIMIEQLLAQVLRQIGLAIVQKRGDIILQGTPAAALVIHKKWTAGAPQDVA